MSKVLVTGGTGLLGSHLLMKLLSKKHENEIYATYRDDKKIDLLYKLCCFYRVPTDFIKEIIWVKGDICDYEDMCNLFNKGIDYVYHCAAKVSFKKEEQKELYMINVVGTRMIVNLSLEYGIKKLCYVSSVGALGRGVDIIDENSSFDSRQDVSYYSFTKYMGELEVWRGIAEGLDAVIVNPGIMLGIGKWDSGSMNLFKQIKGGLKFYSSGSNGFVDVRDVVEVMYMLMLSNIRGERYVLVADNISYKELLTLIADSLGVEAPKYGIGKGFVRIISLVSFILSLFKRNGFLTQETIKTAYKDYVYSSDKIKKAIDFKFTPIRDTIEWAGQNELR